MTAGKSTADESLDVLTDALMAASRLLVAISARSIADVDHTITIPQLRTLVILANHGSINLATLTRLLDVEPSTTGKMVERLVVAGLIDRRPHPRSRRDLLVQLTAAGSRLVQEVTARRRAELSRVVARMPVGQRTDLVAALTAFTAAAGEPGTQVEVDSCDDERPPAPSAAGPPTRKSGNRMVP